MQHHPEISADKLQVTVSPLQGEVDLSQEGTLDWIHWGYVNLPTVTNRKAIDKPLFSDLTRLGNRIFESYENNPTHYSWNDGTPVPSVPDTQSGFFINGRDSGFEFRVAAATSERTLKIYAGFWSGGVQPKLELQLEDETTPTYNYEVDTSRDGKLGDHGIYNVLFTIRFRSAKPNDNLTVRWTNLSGGGNVELQCATLSDALR